MKRLLPLLGGCLLTSTALAAGQVSSNWTIPADLTVEFSGVTCDNTGSSVDLYGVLVTGGAQARVAFRNNMKGTHELVLLSEVTLEIVPGGGSVSIPKQPARGGVGGNPHISFQAADIGTELAPGFVPFGERTYLGRCVQDFRQGLQQPIELSGQLIAMVQAVQCSGKGSDLTIDLEAYSGGVVGTLFFDNNYNSVVHEATVDATARVMLSPSQFTMRKGWGVGGAGGNPHVFLQFLDDENEPLSAELYLGRCKDLY